MPGTDDNPAVAFLSNQNNFNLSIVRYLRDKGVDAHLLLLNEPLHFTPVSDCYDSTYEEYCSELDWNWRDPRIFLQSGKMQRQLEKFNKTAGINFAPAYSALARRPLDLFIPAGSDIYRCPFQFYLQSTKYKRPRDYYYAIWARLQRRGIKEAGHILFDETNEDLEEKIACLDIEHKRTRLNPPFLYYPQYEGALGDENLKKSIYYEQFATLRDKYDFIVVQHSRQDWKNSQMIFYYKGNEKLIHAFAKLIQTRRDCRSLLVLFDYGQDVPATKTLCKELKIEEHVFWIPISFRKDLMTIIHFSDMGVGELGDVSWLSYATVYEILCMKKPFVGFRTDELYSDRYDSLYPMCNAQSSEEVLGHFNDYLDRPEYYRTMGKAGFDWFVEYATEKPLKKMMEILGLKAE